MTLKRPQVAMAAKNCHQLKREVEVIDQAGQGFTAHIVQARIDQTSAVGRPLARVREALRDS